MNRRETNKEIFKDTVDFINKTDRLKNAIDETRKVQRIVFEEDEIKHINAPGYEDTKIIVSGKRTFEAAADYIGKRVCALNFASATNPGGGVLYGSSAQEESLCRCSTLYQCLNIPEFMDGFYTPHRQSGSPLYNDDLIYSPGVVVFKADTSYPELMDEENWYSVDVITCAAPNLRNIPSEEMKPYFATRNDYISDDELEALFEKRIDRIFRIAALEECEVLILGAFGCGAFRNPPEIVARVFNKYTDLYRGYFETIEYAVFHTDRERVNYQVFMEEF